MEQPSVEIIARVESVLGARALSWRRASGGYSPALRWSVRLDDGRSVFVKVATTDHTVAALRAESFMLTHLREDFTPRMLAFEDGEAPLIVLEDLSHAHWPPPWRPGDVERVVDVLGRVAKTPPPPNPRDAERYREELSGWTRVAADPTPFLSLGLASEPWLERALPVLLDAETRAVMAGDDLLHFDVRSDNICFAGERTVLVDWNWAVIGNGRIDLVAWLPSLRAEGGPPPETVCDDEPELAAVVAGYFASKAGLPPEDWPGAARVREVQLTQLRAALPYAALLNGLPPPGVT